MSFFIISMIFLVIGILTVSLVYTWYLGKRQRAAGGEFDSPIPKAVQNHAYIKNPIFLSYGLFFTVLLLIIFFIALSFYR